jgi:hypothetical protein
LNFQLNETLFTITVGYVMDPDLLFPWTRGAIANGLARYLGKDGGRIAVRDFLQNLFIIL